MKKITIFSIRLYQLAIGPVLRWWQLTIFGSISECKHSPSCSHYTILQIEKHGTIAGLSRGLRQLVSCW